MDINKIINEYELLQKKSSQVQILIEYHEHLKTVECFKWLLSVSKDTKNIKLIDTINLLQKSLKSNEKCLKRAIDFENKSAYYEMMYISVKNKVKFEEDYAEKKIIELNQKVFELESELRKYKR